MLFEDSLLYIASVVILIGLPVNRIFCYIYIGIVHVCIFIYIYIYICACVCICIYILLTNHVTLPVRCFHHDRGLTGQYFV